MMLGYDQDSGSMSAGLRTEQFLAQYSLKDVSSWI